MAEIISGKVNKNKKSKNCSNSFDSCWECFFHFFSWIKGWWSGGFGYGLWIGILVALGFSVVPVSSISWKNKFELTGGMSTKVGWSQLLLLSQPIYISLIAKKFIDATLWIWLITSYWRFLIPHNLKNGNGNNWLDINPTLEWWTLYYNHSILKKLAYLVSL